MVASESLPGVVENINRGGSLIFVTSSSPGGVRAFRSAMVCCMGLSGAGRLRRSLPRESRLWLCGSVGGVVILGDLAWFPRL